MLPDDDSLKSQRIFNYFTEFIDKKCHRKILELPKTIETQQSFLQVYETFKK